MDNIDKGVMADLQRVKAGSYSQVSGDVLDHVLYDEVLFAATTARASTSFFTTPIGGAFGTVTKTKQETNMTDPGKLPAGQGFLIKEIGWSLPTINVTADNDAGAVMQAIINILAFSVFEIRIAGREFDLQFPGTMFLPALANRSNSVIVAATALQAYSGEFLASGWFKLAAPIILGELVSFSVVHLLGSAVAANQTILNTASDLLATQVAPLQLKLRGTLVRSK
jgi:hypothetical protein